VEERLVKCPKCNTTLQHYQDGSRTANWCNKCEDDWSTDTLTIMDLQRKLVTVTADRDHAHFLLANVVEERNEVVAACRAALDDLNEECARISTLVQLDAVITKADKETVNG
jgi:hypothetical protein